MITSITFRLLIYAGWLIGRNLHANGFRLFIILTYSRLFLHIVDVNGGVLCRIVSPLPTTAFKIYAHVFVYTLACKTDIIIMEQKSS